MANPPLDAAPPEQSVPFKLDVALGPDGEHFMLIGQCGPISNTLVLHKSDVPKLVTLLESVAAKLNDQRIVVPKLVAG